MVRHTLKILQQMLQDFWSISDHFTTLQSKGLRKEPSAKLKELIFATFFFSVFSWELTLAIYLIIRYEMAIIWKIIFGSAFFCMTMYEAAFSTLAERGVRAIYDFFQTSRKTLVWNVTLLTMHNSPLFN